MSLPSYVLAAGGASENPHGLLIFSLLAIAIGLFFVVMGRQMSKEEPENRGNIFPRLSISWWQRHPRLSIVLGSFWMVVGSLTVLLYLLWVVGVVRLGQ